MARIRQPSVQHGSDVFASVFPRSSVRSPKHRKQFERKQKLSLETVRQQLQHDSRRVLGIGDTEVVLHVPWSNLAKATFKPYFPASDTLSALSDTPGVRWDVCGKVFGNLRSWKDLPSWCEDHGLTRVEKLFAGVIDGLVSEYIQWSYGGYYEAAAAHHLQHWVRFILWPFVSSTLSHLRGDSLLMSNNDVNGSVTKWINMALTRLSELRIAELFDIVIDWDATAPAVDDLKFFTTNPATRNHLATDFAGVLTRRLLHPGASTIEILQIYISIIKAFRQLDARGVILERVARKIRLYLRHRDDTIKVVVAGLLADIDDHAEQQDPEVLGELAVELQNRQNTSSNGDEGLDWNNMEWMPDPVDAAPDYLKSRSTDVIGSLISLLESKDVFVKELQIMLADRLLKNKSDFDQEISVVEHLKIRFGDAALQGCEVMLRDVLDSRKVDQVIRQDQNMNGPDIDVTRNPEMHTKILSRLFWPSLQEQTFNIPSPIQEQQKKYEKGFESLKQTRKLTWLNAIGQVEIELELEDRTFHDEVLPWQASVIYAFQDPAASSSSSPSQETTQPMTKTLSSLAAELAMTPSLVWSACMFWCAKRILHQTSRDTFAVLERLPTSSELLASQDPNNPTLSNDTGANAINNSAATAAAAEAAAAQAAREVEEAERKQKMAMYHQFISSMLTNQGSMPLPRIAMMLGMVVPGGFPFGNEELREFLSGMVKEGVLEIGNGGAYKIKT